VRRQQRPPLITDADPSLAAEQRVRKRRYVSIMAVPVGLLVVACALMATGHWWLALAAMALCAPMPTVAALATNAGSAGRTRAWFARRSGGGDQPEQD
jgi:hypothetical protein